MADSPRLDITYLEEGQASAEVLVNELINKLEVGCTMQVLDKDNNTPPTAPSNGDIYITGSAATGAWAGQNNDIAIYYDGWIFFDPIGGMVAFVEKVNGSAEEVWYGYSSAETQWHPLQSTYDTTEYWTGKYYSGSMVYAKTWTGITLPDGSTAATSTDTALSLASGTLGTIVESHIWAKDSANDRIAIPWYDGTNAVWVIVDNTNIEIWADWDASDYTGHVTLEFIKA